MKEYIDFFKNKLKKINTGKLLYDNKIVFLFSVLISFSIWICINVSGKDSDPVTISDIPVSINLSESAIKDGLRIFSGQNTKVQIDISGNKLIVGQVKKDDIQVLAPQVNTITSPGTYTLELTAKKVGILSDYEFVSSLQPSFITIMVDRYREAEFTVEPEIEFSADPSYFLGATVLSSPKVMLSGPELEISKIKRVVAKGKIKEELTSTYTTKLPITMYDDYGKQIISETISSTVSEVDVTIPVLMKKKMTINPNFENVPEGLDIFSSLVKVDPTSLEIAGPEDQIAEIDKIELDFIDFNELNVSSNKFSIQINLPGGCRSLNNVYTAEVSVDTSGFKEKTFSVSQISCTNIPEGKTASVYTGKIEVKVVGPASSIRKLTSDNISAEVDLESRQDLSSAMEVPAKIKFKNFDDVWAYGEYLINIEIT